MRRFPTILLPRRRLVLFLVGGVIASGLAWCAEQVSWNPPTPLKISFAVSPGGGTVVFTGYGSGVSNFYTLALKTRLVSRLTQAPIEEKDPCCSRDGKWIAFSGRDSGEHTEHLFLMDRLQGRVQQLTSGDFSDRYPNFSPDGRQVLFARGSRYLRGGLMDGQWGDWDVYSQSLGNLKPIQLTRQHYVDVERPQYLPDGKRYLYGGAQGDAWDICIAGPGSGPRVLLHNAWDPALAPDGERMAFTRDERLNWLDLKRGASHSLAGKQDFGDEQPGFLPDGRTLLFLSGKATEDASIFPGLWQTHIPDGRRTMITAYSLFEHPLAIGKRGAEQGAL